MVHDIMMTKALQEAQDSLSLVFEEGRLEHLEPLLRLIFQTLISHEVGLDKSILEKSPQRQVFKDEVACECIMTENLSEVEEKHYVPAHEDSSEIPLKTAAGDTQQDVVENIKGYRDSDDVLLQTAVDTQQVVVANAEEKDAEEIALESRANTQHLVLEIVATHTENGEIVQEAAEDTQQVVVEDVATRKKNDEIVQEFATDTREVVAEHIATLADTAEIERQKTSCEKELADQKFKELMFEGFIGAIRRRDATRKAESERIAAKEAEEWLAEDVASVEKQPVLPIEVAGNCDMEHSEVHSAIDEGAKPNLASEPLVEEGVVEAQSSVNEPIEAASPMKFEDDVDKVTLEEFEPDLSRSEPNTLHEEPQTEKVPDSAEDVSPPKDPSSHPTGNAPGSEDDLPPPEKAEVVASFVDTLQETATREEPGRLDAESQSEKLLTGNSAGETPSTTADPSGDDASDEKHEIERSDSTNEPNKMCLSERYEHSESLDGCLKTASESTIEAERCTEVDAQIETCIVEYEEMSKEIETTSKKDIVAAETEASRIEHAESLDRYLETVSETPVEAERCTEVGKHDCMVEHEGASNEMKSVRANKHVAAETVASSGSNQRKATGPPGSYKVIHKKVVMRGKPTVDSSILDVKPMGTVVFGTPYEISSVPWLKLSGSSLELVSGKFADEAWLLIDGVHIGLGKLLERESEGAALSQEDLKKLMESVVTSMPDLQTEGSGATWVVVGGAGKGGVLVRSGEALDSRPLPSKLVTGSKIEEIEIIGNRFHYRRLRGDGPDFGWINISLHNRPLIQLLEQEDD